MARPGGRAKLCTRLRGTPGEAVLRSLRTSRRLKVDGEEDTLTNRPIWPENSHQRGSETGTASGASCIGPQFGRQ